MLGTELHQDNIVIDVIKEKLTRALPAVLPDVIDELTAVIPEFVRTKDDGTVSILCDQVWIDDSWRLQNG